jgi:hypothetical protein
MFANTVFPPFPPASTQLEQPVSSDEAVVELPPMDMTEASPKQREVLPAPVDAAPVSLPAPAPTKVPTIVYAIGGAFLWWLLFGRDSE